MKTKDMIIGHLGNPIAMLRQDLKISSYPEAVQQATLTYALAIHADEFEPVNWWQFNGAIIEKWGVGVLITIKEEAWKLYHEKFN